MKKIVVTILSVIIAAHPAVIFAAPTFHLLEVYEKREDLQMAFDPETYKAIPGTSAGFLIDLEDWAHQYGWREHLELAPYTPVGALPSALPVMEPEPEVSGEEYIVIDRQTGQILAAKRGGGVWPVASLTKLVTADIVLGKEIPLTSVQDVRNSDNVGGARLYVEDGTTYTLEDLLYATLTASANNAAYAISRSTHLGFSDFVAAMNARVAEMNLNHTTFVDPSGIELGNVSTPREIAAIATEVFKRKEVRTYTSTVFHNITALTDGAVKRLTTTNWMLYYPEYEDVFIMSGKTGYLDESKWNLVVSIRPEISDEDRELLIVMFGADSRSDSFKDTKALAEWTWENHEWNKKYSF
jgi:D-alanyl-D-alanine carboxypeptidase